MTLEVTAIWLVILNPAAGGGKAGRRWAGIKALLQQHHIAFEMVATTIHKKGNRFMQEGLQKGYRNFICVGGDGHLHDMVNGLFTSTECDKSEITFAMVSVGTGNDWARNFNMHRNLDGAVQAIVAGNTMNQRVGVAKSVCKDQTLTTYFHSFAGVGFDAAVVRKIAGRKTLGRFSYFMGLLTTLWSFRKRKLLIRTYEETWQGNVYLAAAGIGKFMGGGMNITPRASFTEDKLSISIAGDFNTWQIIMNLHKLYDGTLLTHPNTHHLNATHAILDAGDHNTSTWLETDGEPMGHGPFELSLHPYTLRIIIPKK